MAQFLYDSEYQSLFLAECLHNVHHCEIVRDSVKAENFSDKCLQWYFDTITKSPIHLTKTTLKEELLKASAAKLIRKEDVNRYLEVYKTIAKPPLPVESEHIRETLVKFIRTQNTRKAIMDSMDLIQEESWDTVVEKITSAVNSGVDIMSMGQDYLADADARLARRAEIADVEKMATGIPDLDMVLNGGIKQKQVMMCVGGSGRGKSQLLVWLARQALLFGKNVVYFTFEITEDDIAERLDSMVSRVRPHELRLHAEEVKEKLDIFGKRYAGGRLLIKEYVPDEVTVPQLKVYLRQLSLQGTHPDLVIVDYLDLIKPHRTYGDPHFETDAICKALCGLAKEFNTRVVTASQLNRGGMVAENPDESSIAGSISKIYNVDICVYLAQTKDERELEEMRLLLIKSRNGQAGKTVKIETDYGYMTFYRRAMKKEEGEEETSDA